jgi:hypothetical protein
LPRLEPGECTIKSLFALYKTHAASPWRRLSASSRQSYGAYSKSIARDWGDQHIVSLTSLDMMNWADSWAAPIGICGSAYPRANARNRCFEMRSSSALHLGFPDAPSSCGTCPCQGGPGESHQPQSYRTAQVAINRCYAWIRIRRGSTDYPSATSTTTEHAREQDGECDL